MGVYSHNAYETLSSGKVEKQVPEEKIIAEKAPEEKITEYNLFKPDYNGDFKGDMNINGENYFVQCIGGKIQTTERAVKNYLTHKGCILLSEKEI